MAKDKYIQIRLTEEERADLESISKIQGFANVSEYVRFIAFKTKLSNKDKDMVMQELKEFVHMLQALILKINRL